MMPQITPYMLFVRRIGMVFTLLSVAVPTLAQSADAPEEHLWSDLEYRLVGPFRGGRSAAVTGVPGSRSKYYFGATGGGVWYSDDAGESWQNTSDGFFGGSIGAVAVSEWDPNVIYVGGGEKTVRGNVSHGYGMFRSVDAGKTWQNVGLEDSRHIARIRIHPRNPDLVYAAVMGHLFGPNEQRGVFRSTDGGETWGRILFVNEHVGAVDLVMDPSNPRILYATTWRIRRTPYSLESGGEGSGLWKSTDAGETWTELTRKPGLPEGTLGIIAVAPSPANPSRVWAIIEAEDGGVFRSEDGGSSWRKVNDDRNLRQRAWYYTRIYADPQNEEVVYVLNVSFWRSSDAGETFESIDTPHGDHHDLWIDPDDPDRMIIGDDGGAQVSENGGETWTTYHNQPTAQFYRVTTDNHFPYRIYGAQQDNSTVRILSRSGGGSIDEDDWEPTAGGESGHIAPHPENPEIVYGGSYGGFLQRLDHAGEQSRLINVWPDNPMGHGAGNWRYRFQWNFPLLFSPHDPDVLYAAGNVLFRTTNEGQNWEAISPDLTRAEPSTLGPSGGPITKDNTGVEYYGTIFAVAESVHEAGVIWCGSDDGLIHLTRDGGGTWMNVTPPESMFPEWMMVNDIVIHPAEPGGVYVAATRYKSDDFRPYLYKTVDFGRTWERITGGIEEDHFTRTIEADPDRPGLLYAGTESGMYVSFNDGADWVPFQLNLPVVPITDLTIKEGDLIVATQGRAFWILDDLSVLRQLLNDEEGDNGAARLLQPRPAYRLPGGRYGGSRFAGENPPSGVVLHYVLEEKPADSTEVKLELFEENGTFIRAFKSTDTDERTSLKPAKGLNRFVWDLRYPDAKGFEGLIMWAGGLTGPLAVPGMYQATLTVGEVSRSVEFEVLADPRADASQSDYIAQFDFLEEVRDKLTETHEAIVNIREARDQINAIMERVEGREAEAELNEAADGILSRMKQVEETLYQTKNRSRQDPLNFPIRLNNKLSALGRTVAVGNYRPTDQAVDVRDELIEQIDAQLEILDNLFSGDLPAFNALVREQNVPAVLLSSEEE